MCGSHPKAIRVDKLAFSPPPMCGSHPKAIRLPPFAGLTGGLRWLDAGITMTQQQTRKGLRLHPGIHALDLRDWLLVDDEATYDAQLASKARALADRRADVLQACDPSTLGAQEEVHSMLVKHLPCVHPRFSGLTSGDGDLEAAARLVQEDLVIMRSSDPDGRFRAAAACVCFSFGGLVERMRQAHTMLDLHAKVNGYDTELANPVQRFMAGLQVDRPAWRTNWSISFSGSLEPEPLRYLLNSQKRLRIFPGSSPPNEYGDGPDGALRRLDALGTGESLWVKVEYQTFRRLPLHSDCILFTVRTFLEPLSALSAWPRAATQLATNVRHCAETPFKHYKGLQDERIVHRVLTYLDGISG